jgi:hypothetical protein
MVAIIGGEPQRFRPLIDLYRETGKRFGYSPDLPIVSVDSKKPELVGNFKNPGRRWESAPRRVYHHDFRPIPSGSPFPMEFTTFWKIAVLWWSAFPTIPPPLPLMPSLIYLQ